MLTLDDLNSYFERGYTIETLNGLYRFDLDFACEFKNKDSIFLYRPNTRFVNVVYFIDLPSTRVLVRDCVSEALFECFVTDLY